jgi:hypothetical protein
MATSIRASSISKRPEALATPLRPPAQRERERSHLSGHRPPPGEGDTARRVRDPAAAAGRFRRNRVAMAGLAILVVMAGAAALAGVFLPYGPDAADLTLALHGPTWAHPFGTDELGRDILTRVVYGGRLSLADHPVAQG